MSVVIRLKVPIEMHYTVIPMGTSKVNSSQAQVSTILLYNGQCYSVADIIDTARDTRITHASFSCLTVQLSRHTIAAYAIWPLLSRKIRLGLACEPENFQAEPKKLG